MPTLQYAADIALLSAGLQCPPADAAREARTCFRFVFDPLCSDSFLPVGKITPQRVHTAKGPLACSMLALSMFSTENKARAKYAAVLKTNPNAPKTLGTHLAKGNVSANDGASTPITSSGHFDFHPYVGAHLDSDFVIIGPLP